MIHVIPTLLHDQASIYVVLESKSVLRCEAGKADVGAVAVKDSSTCPVSSFGDYQNPLLIILFVNLIPLLTKSWSIIIIATKLIIGFRPTSSSH
jgi:hypothetical protein